MHKLNLLPFLPLMLLGACTLGPDYAGPPAGLLVPQDGAGFVRAGDAPVIADPPLARWWESLEDPALSELERQALANSPDIAAAEARLRQARAALRIDRADDLPTVSASSTYVHARLPGFDLGSAEAGEDVEGSVDDGETGGTTAANFYNLGLMASWEADLFGGRRRSVEAARASLESAEASLADAQVSLTAGVAQAYVSLRGVQQRIAYAREGNALQRRQLELMRQRFAQGTVSQIEVERLAAQIENSTAGTVPLGAEAEGYANALAVLTGQVPGALDATLIEDAPIPLPPASVAIGDPASLLRRRPDIRAAERRLAESTARIGVAEAARFPRLNFLGILGLGGTEPADLTKLDDFAAIAAPMLQWTFLDFGRGEAQVAQAEGVRDEALAQYRSTVLGALRDAEDALSRFRYRRQTIASLARAEQSTTQMAVLTRQRYEAGTTTLIEVLEAERAHVDAQENLATAKAGLTSDYVDLHKALGLGWESTSDRGAPPDDED